MCPSLPALDLDADCRSSTDLPTYVPPTRRDRPENGVGRHVTPVITARPAGAASDRVPFFQQHHLRAGPGRADSRPATGNPAADDKHVPFSISCSSPKRIAYGQLGGPPSFFQLIVPGSHVHPPNRNRIEFAIETKDSAYMLDSDFDIDFDFEKRHFRNNKAYVNDTGLSHQNLFSIQWFSGVDIGRNHIFARHCFRKQFIDKLFVELPRL